MKTKKSVLFFLFIGLCAAAVSAQTEADFEVDLTADSTGVVIKKYVGKALQVKIPATIQGMPVREIGERAFSDRDGSPNAPPTVWPVNYYSGRTRQGITSVVIPEGVTKIGKEAFSTPNRGEVDGVSSGSLTSITIPNSVTEIGEEAFGNQTTLTAVTLPKNLSKVGGAGRYSSVGIFGGCTALKTVTIPEGVTAIGEFMFAGCTALATITIPKSVTSIGKNAFTGSGLTSITWPAHIPAIPGTNNRSDRGMFENCTKLTTVVLPEGVTAIGGYTFKGCTALASITLPASIFEIGQDAFDGCTALTTVTIPASVKAIYFSDRSGGLDTRSCPKLNLATQAALRRVGAGTRTLAVPDGVTAIAEKAYYDYGALDALIIPPGVTSIGESAFYEVGNSASYNSPGSITIGAGVNMDDDAIRKHFTEFYNNNGKKAGVYTFKPSGDYDGTWTYTE